VSDTTLYYFPCTATSTSDGVNTTVTLDAGRYNRW
jgi:hypothetical protein